ncbi:MAG: hypothetical protein JWM47_1243 [Acidimicrobiales bacterium]|nr:hypothetical protein [Acidimicrobiales bacterium]
MHPVLTEQADTRAVGRGPTRRQTLEISWVVGVVLFVLMRFALAYSALAAESRMTVLIFGLLDLGTAVPYALGTARLVSSLVDGDHQAAARWGAVASGSFLAPYLWIAWAGREGAFPTIVYVTTLIFVVSLGANAVFGIRRRVRAEQAQGDPLAV